MTRIGKLSFDVQKVIGKGSFGEVFTGLYKRNALFGTIFPHPLFKHVKEVAVKRCQRSLVNESLIQNKVELVKKAGDHPNILPYICVEKDVDFIYIATELCKGTLEDYVHEKFISSLMFESESEILLQVTRGLAFLHNLGIVDCNIKPSNILIYEPFLQPNKAKIKLTDFYLSGRMAAEPYESSSFESKKIVDILKLGSIFYYTLSGGQHFFDSSYITREKFKEPYREDELAFKLVLSMMAINPVERPSVEDVLKSDFFIHYRLTKLRFSKNKSSDCCFYFVYYFFLFGICIVLPIAIAYWKWAMLLISILLSD